MTEDRPFGDVEMNNDELGKLITGGETMTVEFKGEKQKQLSDREIHEAVVCMANAEGGIIIIGVEDDGTVTGARPRHGNKTETARLQSAVFNNTEPACGVDVSSCAYEDHTLLVISIPKSTTGVFCTKDGKCVHRVLGLKGPECVPFYPQQQHVYRVATGEMDYSSIAVDGMQFRDLDRLEIERLRQTIRQKGGEIRLLDLKDEDLVKALGLVETKGTRLVPNISGLLLLGHAEALSNNLPTHQVAFQVIGADKEVRVNDWFREPLLKALEQIESRFKNLNTEREANIGLVRLGIPDYSPDAFREAVLNAVQHRNYAILSAIHIQLHSDHLFISSPGGFPSGITLENLLVHEPRARNARLSEVLRRIGLVETTGRGIDKIFYGQLRFGRGSPDYSRSDSEGVRVILMGGHESSRFAVFVAEQEKTGTSLSLDDLLVLDHLRHERRIDSILAGGLTQRGINHGRATLERLMERGIVEARGERRGRVYHLSAAIYKAMGVKSGYIRSKGFDRIKQEAMVIELVKANGRITRSEVAELCNLGDYQATRLLQLMVRQGKITKKGLRRWSYYEHL